MIKFHAKDYAVYNDRYNYNQYEYLYSLMSELFELTGYKEDNYIDGYCFYHDSMKVCIDRDFGSYCEIIGTGWLPMLQRIKLHEAKLKQYKKRCVQLKLFVV